MKKNTPQSFCKKMDNLNKKMYDALVEMVNENGGLIRTEPNNDLSTDNIYGIVWDESPTMQKNVEHPIVAVATWENGTVLGVLFDFTDGKTTWKNESDEELLEDDDWVTIYGGYVLPSPTLYALCETLWQYAK